MINRIQVHSDIKESSVQGSEAFLYFLGTNRLKFLPNNQARYASSWSIPWNFILHGPFVLLQQCSRHLFCPFISWCSFENQGDLWSVWKERMQHTIQSMITVKLSFQEVTEASANHISEPQKQLQAASEIYRLPGQSTQRGPTSLQWRVTMQNSKVI